VAWKISCGTIFNEYTWGSKLNNKYLHKLFFCVLVGYITTPSTLMAAGCNQSFGWAEQLRTLAESDKMQISISAVESLINNEAFENKVNSIENKVKFAGDMYDICKHIEAEKLY
jgi:hypothetical protein